MFKKLNQIPLSTQTHNVSNTHNDMRIKSNSINCIRLSISIESFDPLFFITIE